MAGTYFWKRRTLPVTTPQMTRSCSCVMTIGRIERILRLQLDLPAFAVETLDREFPVYDGDNDVAVRGLQRTIHNQNIAVIQPGILHGIPGQAHIVGGRRVRDQQFMRSCIANEDEGFFNILLDLFVGMLSRPREPMFMAAAPGVNALVADLDEKSKHLGDF